MKQEEGAFENRLMSRKDGNRFCDICNYLIPNGETYRLYNLPPEAAELMWRSGENDPDLTPNWTVEEGGFIRMDICLECVNSMKLGDIEWPPI